MFVTNDALLGVALDAIAALRMGTASFEICGLCAEFALGTRQVELLLRLQPVFGSVKRSGALFLEVK